tara:strand:+ start:188 stop:508 length:321 start_codon:yes stop_codon:yes gene_type:complete
MIKNIATYTSLLILLQGCAVTGIITKPIDILTRKNTDEQSIQTADAQESPQLSEDAAALYNQIEVMERISNDMEIAMQLVERQNEDQRLLMDFIENYRESGVMDVR